MCDLVSLKTYDNWIRTYEEGWVYVRIVAAETNFEYQEPCYSRENVTLFRVYWVVWAPMGNRGASYV